MCFAARLSPKRPELVEYKVRSVVEDERNDGREHVPHAEEFSQDVEGEEAEAYTYYS